MTWREWHAARQMLTEEFVGTLHRQAKAEEDAAFKRSSNALRSG